MLLTIILFMSQLDIPSLEIPDNLMVLHHSGLQSSLDSNTPCTEALGSGASSQHQGIDLLHRGNFSRIMSFGQIKPMELIPFDSDELLVVNSRRRNGLILYKRFHAEFAGPGAAIGGECDRDCKIALPLGNLSLLQPESSDDRQRGYALRRQWIRLIRRITEEPDPLQRAQKILTQFEYYFDSETIAQLPDEALALLIGVFPHTVNIARSLKT
jgi:hypothetical protein